MNSIAAMAPIRQIIAQSLARYATVTPQGILLPHTNTPYNPLPATIIAYNPARTRYLDRKPICRSLDGLHSIDHHRSCSACHESRTCTPQIAIDLTYRNVPFRLILAYTSAKNFFALLKTLHAAAIPYERALISISTIDRGHWGELRFNPASTNPAPESPTNSISTPCNQP